MKKPWFRAKWYGWGWYPVTWQGWLVLLAFVAALILNFYRLDTPSYSAADILTPFIFQTIAMVVILIIICYRTGEKPGWHWGSKGKG